MKHFIGGMMAGLFWALRYGNDSNKSTNTLIFSYFFVMILFGIMAWGLLG